MTQSNDDAKKTAAASGGARGGANTNDGTRQASDVGASRSKTKQGPGRKGRAKGNANQTEVMVGDHQVAMVRMVRTDRKAENAEEDGPVKLSKTGRAQQLVLSDDHMGVTGTKGFRSVRSTHGVHQGTWYCEFAITHLGETGHARLGWATKKAELQAPVGFDEHGFAFRDLEGSKVHQGKREAYGPSTGFKEGDVVGLLLHMPEGGRAVEVRKRKVVRFKGEHYYEEEPEITPKPLPGSQLHFFVNGQPHGGAAFTNVPEGTYYAVASLYTMPEQSTGATVTANFGPEFKFAPPQVDGLPQPRPLCEVAADVAAEKAAAMREEKEAREQGHGGGAAAVRATPEPSGAAPPPRA